MQPRSLRSLGIFGNTNVPYHGSVPLGRRDCPIIDNHGKPSFDGGCAYNQRILVGDLLVRRLFWLSSIAALLLTLCLPDLGLFAQSVESADDSSSQIDEAMQKRFRNFEKRLSGTQLTGQFTMTGQPDRPPTPERYEILKVEKLEKGDFWRITARIKYGDNDVTVPLAIEVKWAGNTPVMTVDSLFVPGLGTFDARVVFRKNKYAGTWAHGDVGGHLFGTFEKMPPQPKGKSQKK